MSNHLGDTNKMVDTPRMDASAYDDGAIWQTGCDIERELNAANQRIKRLEREIELFREHSDYGDVCLVEVILKGEELTRQENQNKQ